MAESLGEFWIVVEYDQVDVRTLDSGPVYVPGEMSNAQLAFLNATIKPSEEAAIDAVAQRGGHYSAFPVPRNLRPRRAELKVCDG